MITHRGDVEDREQIVPHSFVSSTLSSSGLNNGKQKHYGTWVPSDFCNNVTMNMHVAQAAGTWI